MGQQGYVLEDVFFILDGSDDPVQEMNLLDILIINDDDVVTEEPWDGVAR